MDSPRGRIYLMRAAAEGRAELTESFARHMDLCLGCRACESACPSGVPFGSLLEATRAQLVRHGPARGRAVERALHAVFPRPGRAGAAMAALRLARRSGVKSLVHGLAALTPFRRLRAMESLVDDVPAPQPLPPVLPARGPRRGRVGLLTGCVQRHLFPRVNLDTAWLLSCAGYEVVVPPTQGCCGALDLHGGRLDDYRARVRDLADVFPADLDFVVTNAAGCGSAMKDGPRWEPSAGARRIAERTRDVSEVLVDADLPLGPLPVTVTYHDPCHLAHGQRVRGQPRRLLARIPGLRLLDLADSELCCGSAGVYNLLQPDMADRLLELKMDAIARTGATTVATGNPGCLLQIARGCRDRGLALEIVHPVELLARSVDRGRTGRADP
jgi:glycolate oxidase iron-sulfur subunit